MPSYVPDSAAGHTPHSETFTPPGCRPHCNICQQFSFAIPSSSIAGDGKIHKYKEIKE
jgi:hypothetical protein